MSNIISYRVCVDDDNKFYFRQMTNRAQLISRALDTKRASIEALLGFEYEAFTALLLEWASLPPEAADRFIERIAPKMTEFAELMRSNQLRAQRMLAKRKANGHGH